jgi:hypothetical protein
VDPFLPAAQKDHQMQKHDGDADAADGDVAAYEEMVRQSRSLSKFVCGSLLGWLSMLSIFLQVVGVYSKNSA